MKKFFILAACAIAFFVSPTCTLHARVDTTFIKNVPVQSVWAPRKHNPAFIEPGNSFIVEVEGAKNLRTHGWKAFLKNDLNQWTCKIITAQWGMIDHASRPGWLLKLRTPNEVPPELMELVIIEPDKTKLSSPRSVHIVPNLEADFYILHQSDQHTTQEKAGEPGGKAGRQWSGGGGSKEALQWLTPLVNLINPRLIFQTGDNMQLYKVGQDWCGMAEAKRRVNRFFEGFANYSVPIVVATGNHDLGWGGYIEIKPWRAYYTQNVGQRAFSFRMGSMYVQSIEWTSKEFFNSSKKDYEASWRDTTINYRLLISHFYDGLDGWTSIASKEKPCDLFLVGHNHRTRVLQTAPFPVLSVGSAQEYQRAAFLNFHRTNSGWINEQLSQHADSVNVHRLLEDDSRPRVTADYTQPNNGTATSNTIKISNKLPHDFYDGRVRFLMKKGKYTVNGGDILSQYKSADGNITAVLVKVNIRQSGETSVSISE